jgi:hypothetical protein
VRNDVLILIHQIFDYLDTNHEEYITPEQLMQNINPAKHPDVLSGHRTADEVMQEFLDTFDIGTSQPGKVSREEFVNYYLNMSPTVNDDDYFIIILKKIWNMKEDKIDRPPDQIMFDHRGNLVAMSNQYDPSSGNNSNGNHGVKNRLTNAQNLAQEYWGNNPQQQQGVRPSTVGGALGSGRRPSSNNNNNMMQERQLAALAAGGGNGTNNVNRALNVPPVNLMPPSSFNFNSQQQSQQNYLDQQQNASTRPKSASDTGGGGRFRNGKHNVSLHFFKIILIC